MVGTHARTLQLGNEGIYLVYPLVMPYGLLDSSVYITCVTQLPPFVCY